MISIAIAYLQLMLSFGFQLGTHYCMGRAVETKIILNHRVPGCGMEEVKTDCEKKNEHLDLTFSNTCCDSKILALDIEDDFNLDLGYSHEVYSITENVTINALTCTGSIEPFIRSVKRPPPISTNQRLALHQIYQI